MAEANDVSSSSAKKQSMVRLDIYVKRHPSLSSAEFHERWSKVHGTLVKGWLAEKGIYRYTQVCAYIYIRLLLTDERFVFAYPEFLSQPDRTQYHTPPEMCTQALGIHDDARILDFDGHAEVVVLNIDVLKKLVEDDFFSEFAKPDEEALVDMNSVMRTIGYEEIHVENGKAV